MGMEKFAGFTAVCFGLFISVFVIWIYCIADQKKRKKAKEILKSHGKIVKIDPSKDWLFGDFGNKYYKAILGNKEPEAVAVKVGIDLENYYQACVLTETEPNVKLLDIYFLYGVSFLLIFGILTIFGGWIFMFTGICLFSYFALYQQNKLNHKKDDMKIQVADELPRFLDLLQAELETGMPIENAIMLLCTKTPELLISREFLSSIYNMRMGGAAWQDALNELAKKYDVETLSDFVLNVTTAYNQGTSILETVARKNKDTKKTHLLSVKERAGKATNEVLIPVALFQIIPMIAFLMIPAFMTITKGF